MMLRYPDRTHVQRNLLVRSLYSSEWPAYERVLHRAFRPIYGWTKSYIKRILNEEKGIRPGRSPKEQFSVAACLNETIVGCGLVSLNKMGEFEVKRVCVDPKFQGYGISRKIMDELERIAKTNGISELVLYALSSEDFRATIACESLREKIIRILNADMSKLSMKQPPDLVELYSKFGYSISGEDKFEHPNLYRTRMTKSLREK